MQLLQSMLDSSQISFQYQPSVQTPKRYESKPSFEPQAQPFQPSSFPGAASQSYPFNNGLFYAPVDGEVSAVDRAAWGK